MSDSVIFPPRLPPIIAGRFVADDELIWDLLAASALSDTQRKQIADTMERLEGFMDFEAVQRSLIEMVGDSEKAHSVFHVLYFLRAGDLSDLFAGLEAWRRNDSKAKEQLSDTDLGRIKTALQALVRPYPALERHRKAERLTKVTGHRVKQLEIICDLRPIFDEAREHIEGMIPYTILRLVVEGADGHDVAREAILSVKQVHDIIEKAKKAEKKLEVLRQHVSESTRFGLPKVSLVRSIAENEQDA